MKNKLLILALLFGYLLNAQTTFNFGWAHGFGAAGNEECYYSKTDATGNVYVTGRITGTVDFDPGVGTYVLDPGANTQAFIVKYSPGGNLVWAKVLETAGIGSSQGIVIGVDPLSNVYVTGFFNGTVDMDPGPATLSVSAIGNSDLFMSKFDINGSLVWNKNIGGASTTVNPNDMKITPAGDLLIIGNFNLTVDFDASGSTYTVANIGYYDAFIMKYNTSGNFQWAFAIGQAASDDNGIGLDFDVSGNIYISGSFSNTVDFDPSGAVANVASNGDEDAFLAKYSSSGAYLWAGAIGGTGKDIGYRVNCNAAGEVLLNSTMQSTVLDADPSPATSTLAFVGTAPNNAFLGKYTSAGTLIWGKNTGGNGAIGLGAYNLTSDAQNNIYLCGFFDGTTDFDFTNGTNNLTAQTTGGTDIFIAKYDNSGNYILAKSIGGGAGNGNEGYCVNITANNEIVICGHFVNTQDFDFSGSVYTQTAVGGVDFFIAKYSQCINPTIPVLSTNAATICGIGNSATLSVTNGTLNSATDWFWYTGSCGGTSVTTGSTVVLNPAVNTTYFVKGYGGCITAGGSCASVAVTVLPLKNVSGQVTTASITPVAGVVVLYKYEGGFTKYDSLTYQPIDGAGNFTFASIGSGSYILQAVPTATNLQITYNNSAIGWKGATIITHGCAVNTTQNINVVPLTNIVTGPGVLTGQIMEGLKYGQKGQVVVPGGPIKGVLVKCGKNPGGDIVAQGRTLPTGSFTFSDLPVNAVGESYFILVDITGLDTNGTYHKVISVGTSTYTNLDFVADSAKITPGLFIGIKHFSTKDAEVNVYPNPTNGIINFEINSSVNQDVSIKITNLLGEEINTGLSDINTSAVSETKLSCNLKNQATGIYFLNIKIGNDVKKTKIILTH